MPRQQRNITTRAAALEPNTANEDERSVQAVIASERLTQVFDMENWRIIDEVLRMDGATLPEHTVMLDTHDRSSVEKVYGSVRGYKVQGNRTIATLVFADDGAGASRAWGKVKDGHIRSVSSGYRVTNWIDIPPGKTETVRGKKYKAQKRTLRISTEWEPIETSVVPIGADADAKIRGEAEMVAPYKEIKAMDPEEKARQDAEAAARAAADATRATPPPTPQPPAPAPPAPPTVDAEAERAEGAKMERARTKAIDGLADGTGVTAEVVERAKTEGWTVDMAAAEFLGAVRESRANPEKVGTIEVGEDRARDMVRAVADAIAIRGGVKIEDPKGQRAAEEFRGVGLHDVARIAVRAAHEEVPHTPEGLFKRAISTGSFAEMLGESAYKTLQAAYLDSPGTFQQWAGTRDVANFLDNKNIKLSGFASVPKIGDGGEITHGVLAESKETYSADTYGTRYSVTRKMFINDNMGGFLRIPGELGRAAQRNIDDIGYDLLISASGLGPTIEEDSVRLFGAHEQSNYSTGASASALDDTGMKAARLLMRKIRGLKTKDGAGARLNLRSATLLVPAALEDQADRMTTSRQRLLSATGTSTAEITNWSANPFFGLFRVIAESRLDDATNGATAWYLIADRSIQENLVIVALRGNLLPVVERADPVDVLGIGWRMYHDVGVGVVDWRGIVRSKGA